MSTSWSVCLWVEIVNVCICQDVLGFMCVFFSISLQWNVCIYVWICLCIYVFIWLQSDEREIEREREKIDMERGR